MIETNGETKKRKESMQNHGRNASHDDDDDDDAAIKQTRLGQQGGEGRL